MYEKLVEVRRITEWKDGCIYKTEPIGERWIPIDTPMYSIVNNEQYVSLSSKRQQELNGKTVRKVRE
jgi:hypothetical protein